MATVSKSMEMFLKMQRIQLLEGDVWGIGKILTNTIRFYPQSLKK